MTTEDDFHRALDANPEDWQTRLVFADWLEERDDPRAEGYRALAFHPLKPTDHRGQSQDVGLAYWKFNPTPDSVSMSTWNKWWDLVEDGRGFPEMNMGKFFPKVSHAESAFALAFANLPADRRAELLHQAPVPSAGV